VGLAGGLRCRFRDTSAYFSLAMKFSPTCGNVAAFFELDVADGDRTGWLAIVRFELANPSASYPLEIPRQLA
jgi:hypothetical protein